MPETVDVLKGYIDRHKLDRSRKEQLVLTQLNATSSLKESCLHAYLKLLPCPDKESWMADRLGPCHNTQNRCHTLTPAPPWQRPCGETDRGTIILYMKILSQIWFLLWLLFAFASMSNKQTEDSIHTHWNSNYTMQIRNLRKNANDRKM